SCTTAACCATAHRPRLKRTPKFTPFTWGSTAMATIDRITTITGARDSGEGVVLQVSGLNTYYGQAHAVPEVAFTVDHNVLAVVGKNGMGKTSICNAITGLVPASGSIRFLGQEIIGLSPHRITHAGIGYVPQGRRVWPSLTVDEHLKLSARTASR